MELDRVLIIPSHVPPHKAAPDLAPDETRLAMCQGTFDDSRFVVSRMELDREGKSYTVDTLRALRESEGGELYFLIGDDMLLYFDQWFSPHEILQLCRIVTSVRSTEVSLEDLEAYARTHFPEEFAAGRFVFLPMEPFPVSSTEIREAVHRGDSITGLVTAATEQLIEEERLYR